jgi:predicted MFS family arabinose efflux permease
VRPGPAASTAIMALLVLVATTRTVAGSALALQSAGDRRLAAMGVRAATGQFGYLVGAAVGGVALATGGYELLAASLAALFILGTVPHLATLRPMLSDLMRGDVVRDGAFAPSAQCG